MLWSLNKIMYAGVLTATSVKRESGNTAQTKLKQAIKCKQRKVSGARVKLSKLAAELKRRQDRRKFTNIQERNITELYTG